MNSKDVDRLTSRFSKYLRPDLTPEQCSEVVQLLQEHLKEPPLEAVTSSKRYPDVPAISAQTYAPKEKQALLMPKFQIHFQKPLPLVQQTSGVHYYWNGAFSDIAMEEAMNFILQAYDNNKLAGLTTTPQQSNLYLDQMSNKDVDAVTVAGYNPVFSKSGMGNVIWGCSDARGMLIQESRAMMTFLKKLLQNIREQEYVIDKTSTCLYIIDSLTDEARSLHHPGTNQLGIRVSQSLVNNYPTFTLYHRTRMTECISVSVDKRTIEFSSELSDLPNQYEVRDWHSAFRDYRIAQA